VEIEAVRGDVEVLAWDEPRVTVEVRKNLRAGSERRRPGPPALSTSGWSRGGGLKIQVVPDAGAGRPEGLETDFTVTVPRKRACGSSPVTEGSRPTASPATW